MIVALALAMAVWSCGRDRHDSDRSVMDVSDLLVALDTEDLLIGKTSNIYVFGDRVYIVDSKATDKVLYVFDAESGRYIGSALKPGPSPYEIAEPGALGVDATTGDAMLFDYGQNRIVAFNVDSILSANSYGIRTLRKLDMSGFPDSYVYLNDSTGYGRLIVPDGGRSFSQTVCRYDMATGGIRKFHTSKAVGEANRSSVAVSPDGKTIVEACRTQDLIVVYDSEGNPVKEIKGKAYDAEADQSMSYYSGAAVTDSHILAAYSGRKADDGFYGDRIKVYDLEGNHVKTLDPGIEIRKMAYSPTSDNLYISTPDSIQFAILPLGEIDGMSK